MFGRHLIIGTYIGIPYGLQDFLYSPALKNYFLGKISLHACASQYKP